MPAVSFSLEVRATNYEKIRKAITTMASVEWYRGIIRDTARDTLDDFAKYAGKIAHRLTGHLADSFMWEYDSHSSVGRVFINPRIVYRRGRRTLQWPKIYGPFEHARGGSHAFFDRTLRERGAMAEMYAMRALVKGIPPP